MTGRATWPSLRAAQLMPMGVAYQVLVRGAVVRKTLLEHCEAWRRLSREERHAAMDPIHEARRIAHRLGLEQEEKACESAINVLDALAADEVIP